MAKSSNQKLKLLYLAKIFLENTDSAHALTIKELSEELARYEIRAERKSLYDDIELLRVFGLDICVTRDRSVRYYVGAHTLDVSELKLLADAVGYSKFITEKKSGALTKKLEGLVSRHQAAELRRQGGAPTRLKAENEETLCHADMIRRAMSEDRRIGFKRFEWSTDKRRQLLDDGEFCYVSPWAICRDDECYYLIAFDGCDGVIKHYRMDRMIELHIDKERREGADSFGAVDVNEYLRYGFGMGEVELCPVRLSCDTGVADAMLHRFGSDIIIANHGDKFEFTVKVPLSDGFYSWVLGFGGRVRVVTPDRVRDRISELARGALSEHEN